MSDGLQKFIKILKNRLKGAKRVLKGTSLISPRYATTSAQINLFDSIIAVAEQCAEDAQTATGGNPLQKPEHWEEYANPVKNSKMFDNIVNMRLIKSKAVLSSKAVEYAFGGDRFHNFKVAARMNNTTPEKALKGMMLKHEVSVSDLIENPESATLELINEKIGNNINYLILLEGLLTERINNEIHVSKNSAKQVHLQK